MRQDEIEIPRKVAHVGAMIEKLGTSRFMSAARATNFRCPEHILAEVDAMGELATKSRNSMLAYLLEAAIEEVRSTLDDDTIHRLNAATSERLAQFHAHDAERVEFSDEE
jgi:hypothetical protein